MLVLLFSYTLLICHSIRLFTGSALHYDGSDGLFGSLSGFIFLNLLLKYRYFAIPAFSRPQITQITQIVMVLAHHILRICASAPLLIWIVFVLLLWNTHRSGLLGGAGQEVVIGGVGVGVVVVAVVVVAAAAAVVVAGAVDVGQQLLLPLLIWSS